MSALRSERIEPESISLMPTADGGAVLRLTESDEDVRVILTIDQTNTILRALLGVATIKIEAES